MDPNNPTVPGAPAPNANPPPAAPPAAAPPPAAPPVQAQPPLPGVPAPAAPPTSEAPPRAKTKGRFIKIPEKDFSKRVKQAGRTVAVEELGMSLDEAKAKLAAAQQVVNGGGADPVVRQELEALRASVANLTRERDEAKERTQQVKTRERNRRFEIEIKGEARAAGVLATEIDYALELYRRVVADTEEGKDPPDPATYFQELRKTRAYLYGTAAPAAGTPPATLPVRPSTAPPDDPNAGAARPPATPPGAKSVDEMSSAEFSARTKSTYGWVPGS